MPKEHPDDIMIVHNIDVGCEDKTQDMVIRHKEVFDEAMEKNKTISIREPEEWSHKDYFQVKWDGHPHRIGPGETKRMPRYIANQFKKHLTDHILIKREEETGQKGLMQNKIERVKVEEQIIIGVDTYLHEDDEKPSDGEIAARKVEELNKPKEEAPKPSKPIEPLLKKKPSNVAKTSVWDKDKPNPTRKELLKECEANDIETTGKETVDELIGKIKAITP